MLSLIKWATIVGLIGALVLKPDSLTAISGWVLSTLRGVIDLGNGR